MRTHLRSESEVLGFLGIFLILCTYLAVGDFPVRLANSFLDDSPVMFARFFANPEHWAGDAIATAGYTYTLGSLVNLIPAVLLKTLGVPPEPLTALITYLQNLLFGLGLYYLARRALAPVSGARFLALLVAAFAMTAQPEQWNLGCFSGMVTGPYPAQFVMGLLALSATFLIDSRYPLALGALLLAGLIHPALSLQMAIVIGLCAVLEKRWRIFPALAGVVAIFVVPALVAGTQITEKLSRPELMQMLKQNGHFFPLLVEWSRGRLWQALPSFVGLVALAVWSWRKIPLPAGYRRLVLSLGGASVLGLLTYVLGAGLGIPTLIQLSGPRVTSLLVLFSLPMVMGALVDQARTSSNRLPALCAVMSLVLLATHQFGFFWGPALALFLAEKRPRGAWAVFVLWNVAILGSGILPKETGRLLRAGLAPGAYLDPKIYLASLLAGGAACFVPQRVRTMAPAVAALIVAIGLWGAVKMGHETRETAAVANYQAQLWAHDNTPPDAIFVIVPPTLPWRVLSQRRAIFSDPGPSVVYSASRRAAEMSRRQLAFYDERGKKDLETLNEPELVAFTREFGGNYIVVDASHPLTLPVAYRNEGLIIHRVP